MFYSSWLAGIKPSGGLDVWHLWVTLNSTLTWNCSSDHFTHLSISLKDESFVTSYWCWWQTSRYRNQSHMISECGIKKQPCMKQITENMVVEVWLYGVATVRILKTWEKEFKPLFDKSCHILNFVFSQEGFDKFLFKKLFLKMSFYLSNLWEILDWLFLYNGTAPYPCFVKTRAWLIDGYKPLHQLFRWVRRKWVQVDKEKAAGGK